MSISIQAMEDVATALPDLSFSQDIGNTIEVSELGDDMGMSLLRNPKYSSGPSMDSGTSVSMSGLGGIQEIDVTQMNDVQPINLDLGGSSEPTTFRVTHESSPYQPANSFGMDGSYANQQSASGPSIVLPGGQQRDPIKEGAEKADLINKLQRLEAKGFPVSKRFTMDNSLDEIKSEYTRLVDARQLETSIKFQRNMLMGLVTGLEFMNNKFDPFDLKLDGWGEGVHENIEDYDEIFEELYDKYKGPGKMPPEARLLFQLAGSGFMCHLTNSYFRSKMPSADDIFKKNPELAKQFAAAAASSASPGFGNFMGMAMGATPPQAPPQPQGVPVGMASGPGAFFNSPNVPQHVAANPPRQTARREMSGPSGVDDILKTFEEVRMAEEQQGMDMPFSAPPVSRSPAMAAADEIQSMASGGDLGSIATERTQGGRRRARKAPVGNVVSLNV
jgi:hypothetical protein